MYCKSFKIPQETLPSRYQDIRFHAVFFTSLKPMAKHTGQAQDILSSQALFAVSRVRKPMILMGLSHSPSAPSPRRNAKSILTRHIIMIANQPSSTAPSAWRSLEADSSCVQRIRLLAVSRRPHTPAAQNDWAEYLTGSLIHRQRQEGFLSTWHVLFRLCYSE